MQMSSLAWISPSIKWKLCPEKVVFYEMTFPRFSECSVMEEFKKCGTACEEICDNLGQPLICTQECIPECLYKEDYIRKRKSGCCIRAELRDSKKRSRSYSLIKSIEIWCSLSANM
ncbi:hypothetical protein X798_04512 [Onchocerca flexuosa]|uniref:TIL domain-containing protein n=1 Tax=Onchocerca flexuosa TaxID=387005 RepID=A0A238BT78_9BILA|nr:hypothetical protein X798_04512 [Onchocerca flexuosa]